ncbi:unnamed protein product [Prorocentrum cordatum]|uniref:Uncharacterized protein n=1 Tax=Prorocentrum cordatum TaxID=2364126 RepID=A0ABN9Q7G8_9DINO|nr:unnamed protein product [Polarella glacialis]
MWPWLADRGASLALGYLGRCPAAPSCPPCPSCNFACAHVVCPAAPPCPACPAGAFPAAAPHEVPAAPRGPQAPPAGPCPEPAPCAGGTGGWWIFLLGLLAGVLLSALVRAAWRAAVASARVFVAPRARPADAPALADEQPAAAAAPGGLSEATPSSLRRRHGGMAARTLDMPERQILVDFFDDPILATPNPGQWICSTPDLSIQIIGVTTHRVIPLTRDSEFPRRVRGEVYAFDPLTPEELQQVRREAKELLAVYGLTGAADAQPEGGRWLIADPAHPGFGDALPAAALADGDSLIIRGDRGLACVDEDWLAVERVLDEDLDNWRLLKSTGAGRDRRILGDERVNGVPVLSLTAAARASSKALRPGWPFRGDACAPELVMALVAAGIIFIAHHLDWRTKSGVSTTSGVCRTHRRICEGLDQAICYDQLDFANCAVIEHLARWLYEVESAVRRNPKVPDFTNLGGIFAAPMAEDGRTQLPTLSKWVSSLRRDEAQIMKQERLWSEERGIDHTKHKGKGGKGPGRGGGKGPNPSADLASDDAGDGPRPDPAKDYRTIQGHSHGDPFPLPLSGEAQRSIISRVGRRIENYGERPDILPATAYADLIKSHDLYSGQPMNLKPYDPDLLNALHRDRRPQELRGCLGSEGRRYLDNADELIFRTEAELDALQESELIQAITPPWDPILKNNRRARIGFIKRPASVGLVGFRLFVRGRIGAFCVSKKALRSQGVDPVAADIHAAGLDLNDGFYQFANDDLADWFGFNYPEAASDFGDPLVHIPADGRFVQVSSDTRVFAVFRGLLMGRSWSLFFCRDLLEEAWRKCLLSLGRDDGGRLVHERRPAPLLAPGRPLPQPYVDDANVIGFNRRDIAQRLDERAPLGRRLLDELRAVKGLLLLADVDLAAPWSRVVYCSDASGGELRGWTGWPFAVAGNGGHALHEMACADYEVAQAFKYRERWRFKMEGEELVAPGAPSDGIRGWAPEPAATSDLLIAGLLAPCAKPSARAWRLYLGLKHLLRVRRASGRALRVVYGHLVNHFVIARPALSALDEGRRFIAQRLDERAPLGRRLLDELRAVKGLLLLADVDLAAPWSRVVYCSDASGGELRGWTGWPFAVAGNGGHALHEMACADYEVAQAFKYRERWRFKMEGEELVAPGAPSDGIRGWAPEPAATSDLLIAGLLAPCAKPSVIARRLPRTRTVVAQGAAPALDDALLVRSRWKMIVRGLVRASRDPRMHGLRIGSSGDNMAALLSFEKERARDKALLQLCRVSAARQIGCEIQWKQRHCESGRNPTDADSRAADLGHVLSDHPQRGCQRALASIESANAGFAAEPPGPPARVRRPAPIEPAAGLSPGEAAARLARVGAFARRRRLVGTAAVAGHFASSARAPAAGSELFSWGPLMDFLKASGSHSHEILQGKASLTSPSGAIRSHWKTSLAGACPPKRRAGARAAESVGARRRERAVGADRPYLKHQRVQPRAVSLRREAHRKFSQWASEQHLRRVSMDETDLAMTRYLDHLYFQGLSIAHARNAVHGAIFVKDYPRRSPTTMYRAKDALAGWFKAGPDRVRDPLPWEAAALIADDLAERDREGVAATGALLVSFDGYIRPSNTLAITSREVSQRQARSNPNYPSLVVTIAPQADDHGQQPAPSTKSGDHDCTIVFGDQASLKANRGICRDALLWASRRPDAAGPSSTSASQGTSNSSTKPWRT